MDDNSTPRHLTPSEQKQAKKLGVLPTLDVPTHTLRGHAYTDDMCSVMHNSVSHLTQPRLTLLPASLPV